VEGGWKGTAGGWQQRGRGHTGKRVISSGGHEHTHMEWAMQVSVLYLVHGYCT
jgi:hypothetical protein